MIFSSISLTYQQRFNKILEIGTYDGKTACILSRLFPNSHITTVDLPDDDPIFVNSYNRSDVIARETFIRNRNSIISASENITFLQLNSLSLSRLANNSFDLIWVDGAHGYPIVCCDITNSIRLLSSDGILMCDDVWIKIRRSDFMYSSLASWQTLMSYTDAGIINTKLFRKRLGSKHLINEKYVSYSTLR